MIEAIETVGRIIFLAVVAILLGIAGVAIILKALVMAAHWVIG